MEKRDEEITIIRSKNPNELLVFHASSLENEIRFYINENQYVSAMEKNDGPFLISIGKDDKVEKERSKRKLKKRDYFILATMCLAILAIVTAIILTALFVGTLLDSVLVYLIVLYTLLFLFDIVRIICIEANTTPPRLKSKHSAEHMMVNFLTQNKRLPKNMSELKKASRFTEHCGSRKLVEGVVEEFVAKIVAGISLVIVGFVYSKFFSNVILEIIILCAAWVVTFYLFKFLLRKVDKLNILLKPIDKCLTILAQCANTTKKVKDEDIYLAYAAARAWMIIVYPEHYNIFEDEFEQSMYN